MSRREFMSTLNWSGRRSVVYYALRRLVVAPAPDDDRCFMGAPIGDEVRCPRRAVKGRIWCRRHADTGDTR